MKKRKLEGEIRRTATRGRGKKTPKSESAKIPLDARGYPTGKDGTVWATFDLRQAEIIRNALLTQRIACELRNSKLNGKALYLLRLAGERELEDAMEFIWKDKGGLGLLPDWSYREGEVNRSFERWLSGQ